MNFESAEFSAAELKEVKRLDARYGDFATYEKRMAEKKELQERRQAWVTRHALACFQCGATITDWAAGGKNAWGRLWCLCVRCVRKPKEKEAGSESTL